MRATTRITGAYARWVWRLLIPRYRPASGARQEEHYHAPHYHSRYVARSRPRELVGVCTRFSPLRHLAPLGERRYHDWHDHGLDPGGTDNEHHHDYAGRSGHDTAHRPYPVHDRIPGETKTVWLNRRMLGTGLVLFGGTYTASAIVAGESANPHDNPNLYYPIAGPWMDMAQRGVGAGDKVLLAFDGLTQGIGALAVLSP